MQEVTVGSIPLTRLGAILPAERLARLESSAVRARADFGDRVIWHVNATAHGGGVAEMLQTLLAYGNGARIVNRWLVIDGDHEFFEITKRLHNRLHGAPGDGGPLAGREHAHYQAVLADNLAQLVSRVSPRDLVMLHDPQTAGLREGLRDSGVRVTWRCHIGCDDTNEHTDEAWSFLRPYVEDVDAFVFSRRVYAPSWVDGRRLVVIPPSIDPFSAKNSALDAADVATVLARAGLVSGGDPDGPVRFTRRDGTPGTVRHHARSEGLVVDGDPPPHDAPLVVQVSRWDRLKDMSGVMAGFARLVADGSHRRGPSHARGPGGRRRERRPRGCRGARRVSAAVAAAARRRPSTASTSRRSPWTTRTRTPSSSTPSNGMPTWSCRRAWWRGSGSP